MPATKPQNRLPSTNGEQEQQQPPRKRKPPRPPGDRPDVYEMLNYLEACLVLARDAYARVDDALKRERTWRAKIDERLKAIEQRMMRVEVGELRNTIEGLHDGTINARGEPSPF